MSDAVSPKDFQKAVLDLQTTEPGPGLTKMLIMAALTLPSAAMALRSELLSPAYCLWALFAGAAFASWLITTHDAIHHTLTGWRWFDEVVPRLISHPVFWVHGIYAEVHKLHHKMNGDDFADPERVQWTVEEYEGASALGKFYVRHQWFLDIFVLGGIGLIWKTVRQGLRFYGKSKGVRRQMWLDFGSILALNAAIYAYAFSQGVALKYWCLWVVMERIGGGVLQWRAHVEHYGLWGKGRHYFETQAYNCRNLRTSSFGSWFFNRLNYHSVHHAFPRVPFYKLRAAHERFLALYAESPGEKLVEDESYVRTAVRLARTPSVIGSVDPASPSGRRRMVPVAAL